MLFSLISKLLSFKPHSLFYNYCPFFNCVCSSAQLLYLMVKQSTTVTKAKHRSLVPIMTGSNNGHYNNSSTSYNSMGYHLPPPPLSATLPQSSCSSTFSNNKVSGKLTPEQQIMLRKWQQQKQQQQQQQQQYYQQYEFPRDNKNKNNSSNILRNPINTNVASASFERPQQQIYDNYYKYYNDYHYNDNYYQYLYPQATGPITTQEPGNDDETVKPPPSLPIPIIPSDYTASAPTISASKLSLSSSSPYIASTKRKYDEYGRVLPIKRALLIGINYQQTQNVLNGCVNDVHHIKKFLIEHFEFNSNDIVILTDDQKDNHKRLPTHDNIIRGMQWLTHRSMENDSFFFHYSGHGVLKKFKKIKDQGFIDSLLASGERIPAVCPMDFDKATLKNVIDAQAIHQSLVVGLDPKAYLTAIFDCCHSASMMALPFRVQLKR